MVYHWDFDLEMQMVPLKEHHLDYHLDCRWEMQMDPSMDFQKENQKDYHLEM